MISLADLENKFTRYIDIDIGFYLTLPKNSCEKNIYSLNPKIF